MEVLFGTGCAEWETVILACVAEWFALMKERPRQLQAAFLARIAFDAISGMIVFFALPAPRQMKDEDETTTDEEEDDPGAGRVLEGDGRPPGYGAEKEGKDEG